MKKMLMKITPCLCLVFVFVIGCKSSQKIDDSDQWTKPIPLPEAPVPENWTVSFLVHGMGCPKCANNITLILDDIEGVENVVVDMRTGIVTVDIVGENRPTIEDLAQGVVDSGFTYKGLRSAMFEHRNYMFDGIDVNGQH